VLIRQGGNVSRYATPDDLAGARWTFPTPSRWQRAAGRDAIIRRAARVTTLNDTDLQELSRWLSGQVGPAVSGEEKFRRSVGRGAQRVLVRLAGLPRQRLEARSPTIRIDGQ